MASELLPMITRQLMFGIKQCRREARLMQSMEDAILELDRERNVPNGSPEKAHISLYFAQGLWVEHRTRCPICSRRLLN